MMKFLLLLISSATLLAQRTPLKVNGTVVSNPNFTNSASITWTIVGSNVSILTAGTTINPTDGYFPLRANSTTFADSATALRQGGTNLLNSGRFYQAEPLFIGHNASNFQGVLFPGSSWPGAYTVSSYADDGFGKGRMVVSSADSTSFNGGSFMDVVATTTPSQTNLNEVFTSSRSGGSKSYSWERNVDPYTLANNYMRFSSNSVALLTFDGSGLVHSYGFASSATDAAVTISSTGWTNTFGKNASVFIDGVGLTFTVYNKAGTPFYTNSVPLAGDTILLQDAGKFIITAGTLGVGRATPF